jgi:hypothetical protein
MNRKISSFLFLLILGLVIGAGLSADPAIIPGVVVGYTPAVQDMRVVGGLPRSADLKPRSGLKDLRPGDIFINEDGAARVVVKIYRGPSGQTVIEAGQPRPEEVFAYVHVEDFGVGLGAENIDYLAPGVSLVSGRNADDPPNLFNELEGRARDTVNWFETDERMDTLLENKGGKTFSLRLNLSIPLYSTSPGGMGLAMTNLKKYQQTAKTKKVEDDAAQFLAEKQAAASNPGGADESGAVGDALTGLGADGSGYKTTATGTATGEGTLNFSAKASVQGIVHVAAGMQGGLIKPRLYVERWVLGFIPKFKTEKGHLWCDFQLAQQLDADLKLTMALGYEYKIVLGTIAVADPTGTVMAALELQLRVGVNGSLSIGIELSEYSYFDVGGSADLNLIFIPSHIETHARDSYFNVAFRPTIALNVEFKAGLYPVASIKLAGMSMISVEPGGGLYINGQGYAESLGVLGYATGYGTYGNLREWIVSIRVEAGGFFTSSLKLISAITIPLWSHKWPFWVWTKNWDV